MDANATGKTALGRIMMGTTSTEYSGIAFLLSIDDFDINSGYSFQTYSGTCIKNRARNHIISESDRNGKTQPLEYVTADNYEVNLLNEDLPYVTDYRSQKSLSAEDEYFKKFKNEQLTKAFNLLNPRQQKYISYRFGLGEYDNPHSRNNAAEYFGLTYEKATDLEKEFCDLFGSILGISKVSVIDDFLNDVADVFIFGIVDSRKHYEREVI